MVHTAAPRPTLVASVLVVLLSVQQVVCEPTIAKCPLIDAEDTSDEPCTCAQTTSRTGRVVSIKCKFNDDTDVLLTDALYPFRNQSLVTAYVRVDNASSLHVTESFLKEWQEALSIALDVWRVGTLRLDPTPESDSVERLSPYRTFVGVGIVKCDVPVIPSMFLRDRARGGFRIKGSRVGLIQAGFLHKIEEMRYLVMEDTTVNTVAGSAATEGYVTLSKRQLHSWTGLELSNVTIDNLADNAFNLTHMSDTELAQIVNSSIGEVGSGALTVAGDVEVFITGNTFKHLQKEAFKIAVTGEVKFDENVVQSWEPDALEGLVCHNRTSLERNVVYVDALGDTPVNASAAPFHDSCGSPQLFLVVNPDTSKGTSGAVVATWIITVIIVVLLVAIAVGIVYTWKTQGLVWSYYTGRGAPIYLNGRKTSHENLPNNAEITINSEVPDTGVSNPMYTNTQPS